MSINEKLNRIKEIKGNIKDAIIEKGVEVTDEDSFNSYADKIREIPTGGTPVVPKPEYIPWEKPEGWPDIKEGMQDNQIRMLICDEFGDENTEFTLRSLGQATSCDCTIDWGDGSEPEVITSTSVKHKFNTDNSIKYTNEYGNNNMYIVTVDCRDVRILTADDDISKGMIFWYVNSCTPEYKTSLEVNFSFPYLQCVEFTGGKQLLSFSLQSCSKLKNFSFNGVFTLPAKSNYMFQHCTSLTSLDVSNWDTSNVTEMFNMFGNCTSLTSLDVSNWDTSNVTDMQSVFYYCKSLTSLDVSNWDTSNVTRMDNMFNSCQSLTSLELSNWDTGKVTKIYYMFANCYSLTSLDVSNWNTSSLTSLEGSFNNCYSLKSIIQSWNTSEVTTMSQTFANCYSLTSLDVSNWNTSNVTTLYNMFANCYSLTSLDVSNWNTSSLTSLEGSFNNCYSLKSIIQSWNTSEVTTMSQTFANCYSLTSLDVSNWNTSNVTTMYQTFNNCKLLRTLDISNWVISNGTNKQSMFENSDILTDLNRTYWDFSLVTGSGYSSNCKSIFSNTSLKNLEIILQNSVDTTSASYLPINTTSASNMRYLINFSLTIPRPTFAIKIVLGTSGNKNYNLRSLIVKGEETMDFTTSSPQIDLQYTYAFREEQINEFFTNLPNVDPSKNRTISLKNNPHAQYADITIANEKGWVVLYDAPSSTFSLRDRYQGDNTRLYYRLYPEEEGQFINANGESCNLLWSKYIGLNDNNDMDWELINTFSDALDYYGLEVQEEYREELAKEMLDYANDDSLMIRYNIED